MLVLTVLIVWLALPGMVKNYVNNQLNELPGYTIPIYGNVKDPKTSGWQTFVNILKNAFVQAFHESLSNELKNKEAS